LTTQEDYTFNPVEGIGIDIGRYTSGQPDCWVAIEPMVVSTRGNRVLRLVFNCAVPWWVSTESIVNYGAAMGAAVIALEMQGYQVELWAGKLLSNLTAGGYKNTYNRRMHRSDQFTAIRVKAAGEELNLAKLAFVTSHASMSRRIMFDTFDRGMYANNYYAHGHPSKDTVLPEWVQSVMTFDVFFPSLFGVLKHRFNEYTVDEAEALAIETLVRFQ
jgi:hypothetical protein